MEKTRYSEAQRKAIEGKQIQSEQCSTKVKYRDTLGQALHQRLLRLFGLRPGGVLVIFTFLGVPNNYNTLLLNFPGSQKTHSSRVPAGR